MFRDELVKSLAERVLADPICGNRLIDLLRYRLDHHHQLICQTEQETIRDLKPTSGVMLPPGE